MQFVQNRFYFNTVPLSLKHKGERTKTDARVAAEQRATAAKVAAEKAAEILVEKKKIEDEKKENKRKKEEENKRLAAAAAAVQTSGRRSTRVKRTDHRTRYQGSGDWEWYVFEQVFNF